MYSTICTYPATAVNAEDENTIHSLSSAVYVTQTLLVTAQLRRVRESPARATTELAWEAVAKCQRQRRKDSEIENAQLRVQLVWQRRLARRLQKLLSKRCWVEVRRVRTELLGLLADLTVTRCRRSGGRKKKHIYHKISTRPVVSTTTVSRGFRAFQTTSLSRYKWRDGRLLHRRSIDRARRSTTSNAQSSSRASKLPSERSPFRWRFARCAARSGSTRRTNMSRRRRIPGL